MIVTISRQAASRGEQVAQAVASRLGAPLVDPETVQRAAARIDLAKENLSDLQRADRLGQRLAQLVVILSREPPEDTGWILAPVPEASDPGYRRVTETMLRALGELEDVVIAGFAAQIILAKAPRAVHVLVVAPLATRVQRMVLREDLPFRTAERVIRDADRDRREFYQRDYGVTWDNPTQYDCIVNAARLGVEGAASAIVSAVRQREQRDTPTG